jgi:hypothetical protein
MFEMKTNLVLINDMLNTSIRSPSSRVRYTLLVSVRSCEKHAELVAEIEPTEDLVLALLLLQIMKIDVKPKICRWMTKINNDRHEVPR